MRVADTSALYALFSEDDRFHGRALEDVSAPEPIAVPSEILVETMDLITYRFGPSAGREALDALVRLPHMSVAEKVELSAVKEIYDKVKGMSLADAFVVQTCLALGAGILSYDRKVVAELRRRRPS